MKKVVESVFSSIFVKNLYTKSIGWKLKNKYLDWNLVEALDEKKPSAMLVNA